MTDLREELAVLLDRAEADGSLVVSIQALRQLLDHTPTFVPSELESTE